MITYITEKILNFTISNNKDVRESESEMVDVYRYGIEITISTILNVLLILLASLLQGNIYSGLLFLLCFVPLRFYTGGYHAKTYLKCNTVFLCIFLIICLLSNLFAHAITLKFVELTLLLCFLPIYIFSPVFNENKQLTEKKKRKCKTIASVTYAVLAFISALMFQFEHLYGTIMLFTLLAVVGMIIVEILLQRRKK